MISILEIIRINLAEKYNRAVAMKEACHRLRMDKVEGRPLEEGIDLLWGVDVEVTVDDKVVGDTVIWRILIDSAAGPMVVEAVVEEEWVV